MESERGRLGWQRSSVPCRPLKSSLILQSFDLHAMPHRFGGQHMVSVEVGVKPHELDGMVLVGFESILSLLLSPG